MQALMLSLRCEVFARKLASLLLRGMYRLGPQRLIGVRGRKSMADGVATHA
jgi:hypothetical protein